MARASCIMLTLCVLAALAPSRAGLLDLLWGEPEASPAGGEGEREGAAKGEGEQEACRCAGASCRCCYSALELGAGLSAGAACVAMRYASPSEGLALNVSLGDSLLLRGAVRGARPPPICLDLVSDLAQLCARVGRLRPAADGLRWCLRLEPVLLGDARAVFPLGCFRVDASGMRVDEEANDAGDDDDDAPAVTAAPVATDSDPESEKETNSTEKPIEQLSEEELIAVVNQSAEEGIAFFSNLLGLTFGEDQDSNSTEAVTTSPESNGTSGSTDTEAPSPPTP